MNSAIKVRLSQRSKHTTLQDNSLVTRRAHLSASSRRTRTYVTCSELKGGDAAAGQPLRIAGIPGSLRKASTNTGLLRAVAEQAGQHKDVTFDILDIHNLPLYNDDLVVDGKWPAEVASFRNSLKTYDAFLFSSPEYNYSMTPALKNALDWGSIAPNLWDNKAAAIFSAGGRDGGLRSQLALRQAGVWLNMHFINHPEVLLRIFEHPEMFDDKGNLRDEVTRKRIMDAFTALADMARRFRG